MHFKLLFSILVTSTLLALNLIGNGATEATEKENVSVEMEAELFQKDAIEGATSLTQADCHLRNLDLCYAGLLSVGAKPLPEVSSELESRCDELKVAQLCVANYQARCSSQRDLATAMAMLVGQNGRLLKPTTDELRDSVNNTSATVIDFMALCEPSEKQRAGVVELRQKLFKAGACINARMPALKPCIMDLKTALQLYYELDRKLPLRPTCCAMSRFRHCSRLALDGACGISSLDQLETTFASLTGSSGRMMTQTMERVCRGAEQWQSDYCRELLPPPGMKVPQRRGRKASKLSRALDLLSMAPTN